MCSWTQSSTPARSEHSRPPQQRDEHPPWCWQTTTQSGTRGMPPHPHPAVVLAEGSAERDAVDIFAARESAIFQSVHRLSGLLPGWSATQLLTRLMGWGRPPEV